MSFSQGQIDASVGDDREFYELLVLLKIIGPCIGLRTHGTLRTSGFNKLPHTSLRLFIDRLSWMCDYKSGGDTVTSIALEEIGDGATFWLATSYKYAQAIRAHLTEIIELLSSAHGLSTSGLYNLEQEISNKCIDLASKRVKHYSKLLVCLSEQCRTVLDKSDIQLAQDLLHLTSLASFPRELCAKADHFRDSESLKLLSQRVSSVTPPSVWSMLRHYIGRLGSWHHASRTLVSYASMRPQIFSNFQVEVLATPKPTVVPQANESTYLHSVLSRLFTEQEQLELKQGIETLQRLRGFDLDSMFQKEYHDKNFKPSVHAEVWLLDHFFSADIPFLDNDRQGGSMQRPSHGNVWTNWQSPLHHDRSKCSYEAYIRSAMISKFKEDLKHHILRPTTNHGRIPDTTTGLSLSDV